MKMNETIVVRLGIQGMSEEAITSAEFTWDTKLSDAYNIAALKAAVDYSLIRSFVELSAQLGPYLDGKYRK